MLCGGSKHNFDFNSLFTNQNDLATCYLQKIMVYSCTDVTDKI